MTFNKKTIIPLFVLITIILIISLFRITINILLPENIVSERIQEVFKTSFKKAVKFDRISLNLAGNIVLENFSMSNSTDFNDNINLVKSNKVIIDTSFFNLIVREIEVRGIKLRSPEINIIKSSGKSYEENFSDLFIVNSEDNKLSSLLEKGFYVTFSDSKVIYLEIFKNSRTEINIKNLDFETRYKNKILKYSFAGEINNRGEEKNITGTFSSDGFYNFADKKFKHNSDFKKIDIEYINDFILEKKIIPYSFSGLLSGSFLFASDNDNTVEFDIDIDLNSLSSIYMSDESPYKVIANENFNLVSKILCSRDYSTFNIEKFLINDGNVNAEISGKYVKKESFIFKLNTGNISLDRLSEHITPFRNHTYKGSGNIKWDMEYSLSEKKPEKLDLDFSIKNFHLIPLVNEGGQLNISKCNADIKADNSTISFRSDLKINESDFSSQADITVKNWSPFESDTTVEIKSKRIELSLFKKYLPDYIDAIYSDGFVDLARGYDERSFLNNPEGVLLNSNNINLSVKSENLLISGKADLKNLDLEIALNNGFIRTSSFNLEGYNGVYSGNIYCVLRQSYPYIKIEASGSNMDLDSIMKDAALDFTAGGTLNFDLSYETNAFRVAHFVQNGRGGINIGITGGYISGTEFQKKISSFITSKGYGNLNINNLDLTYFSAGLSQGGANFYIKNFGMRSDKFNFQTYGNYRYPDSLNVPFSVSVKTEEEKTVIVPMLIFNTLSSPCIKINSRKDDDKICF